MKTNPSALYVVLAWTLPGPKWHQVSEPRPRSELVSIIRDHWSGVATGIRTMARLKPVPIKSRAEAS